MARKMLCDKISPTFRGLSKCHISCDYNWTQVNYQA